MKRALKKLVFVEPKSTHLHVYSRVCIPRLGSVLLGTIMRAKGYDYWALGHVHAREIVSTDPYIVYPGNLQGRHARETGPKGATIITTADNVVESVEHRPLDVFRWELVTVDASVASDALEVVDRVRASVGARARDGDGRVLAARVIVSGSTRANTAIRRDEDRFVNEVRAAVTDGLGELAWLEKVIVQTTSHVDLASLREEATAVGHLARRLAVIRESPEDLADIATLFADLDRRLPAELREGEGALRLTDPATIRALIDDVEQMLVPRLLEPETRATARHADRSADPDPRGEA